MTHSKKIEIKGAREHNLKNISIDIPKDKLTVITGLSGSGKSSLAFDTIYAEGQRRYVESLSSYARQFLDLMKKPDVDSIEGLSPAISIEQKTTSHNPRSIVGTVTEIYDYMRLLWARAGTPYSPATGLPIEAQTVSQIADKILQNDNGTKLILLAPIARGKKGEFKKEFENLQKQGYQRINIDGNMYQIDEIPSLNKNIKHDIEVVIDRIVIKDGISERLSQSVETALKLSNGIIFVDFPETSKREIFSSKFACPVSGFTIEEIEPRLFSFNNPFGACPHCDGIGAKLYMDPNLIVPNENLNIDQGAIAPWYGFRTSFYTQAINSLCDFLNISTKTPWKDIPQKAKDIILYGSGNIPVPIYYSRFMTDKPFEGVIPNLERRFLETDSAAVREELSHYQSAAPCEFCKAKRLKPEALAVKIAGLDIMDVCNMSVKNALTWFSGIKEQLTPQKQQIASKILKEIVERLQFLSNVGLEYLTLSRQAGSLSGGEAQRIRLASQIGSGLTGVMYVLDEPSIDLHQRDNDKLLNTLYHLRDIGNTVIVVEHDEDAIKAADYLIDMGPLAGQQGGEIVAKGTVDKVLQENLGLTAQYINGNKKIDVPKKRRKGNGLFIELDCVQTNNLKNVNLKVPLGMFNVVTGVSGSGKTTLLRLLIALITPDSGSIEVYNGKDSYSSSTQTRRNFVYIPQGNSLVSGTIRENLQLGNSEATEDDMRKALHIACANFVDELPEKLDTAISERGGGLSEGQAQRIAVARSLLRPGSIIILDEVTSALDEETEKEMLKRLTSDLAGKTLIFITHRPAIIEYCTQVLRINRQGNDEKEKRVQ